MIDIRIQDAPFDAAAEQARLAALGPDVGAIVAFTGLVKGSGTAGPIDAMTLEHYPAMTARTLGAIAREAAARWPLLGGTVIHRFGRLSVGEPIVLVAIASAHRDAAFAAARFIMDWLKTQAPFWKKEEGAQGKQWVDARRADEAAAARWRS
ncbi:MAG: molybdenum cofactor biosynthesis protein MoaE [Alphaproteobacteria bacterium]|nr:MAG: molybdenum cofactor biosynthesis protein MoaE [Alphaproteobacteria bacterium]